MSCRPRWRLPRRSRRRGSGRWQQVSGLPTDRCASRCCIRSGRTGSGDACATTTRSCCGCASATSACGCLAISARQSKRASSPRIDAAPLTVLRLAHHGSASSTGEAVLEALRPALAIGSMARGNRFGHPAARVVARLQARRVPLLRTDEDGAIQLATNGRVLLVRTMNGTEGSLMAGPPRRAWWLATPPPSPRASPVPAEGPQSPGVSPPIRSGG